MRGRKKSRKLRIARARSKRVVAKRAPVSRKPKAKNRAARNRNALLMAPGLERFIEASPRLARAARNLEDSVTITVTAKTNSGERIQAYRGNFHGRNIDQFRPRPDAEQGAVERLAALGFDIIHRGEFGISVRGPAELVSDVLQVQLAIDAKARRSPIRATQNFSMSFEGPDCSDLFVTPVHSLTVNSTISEHIDDFVFTPPPHFSAAPAPAEPAHGYFGIGRNEIRRLLNVPAGGTGIGVTIGMIDTGFFPHPYYAANNLAYQPTATQSSPDPTTDPVGHGTAMAYNAFAVAPGVTLKGFRVVGPAQVALEEAARAGVDIISCAWGFPGEARFPVVEATIASIINQGKVILFASGDGVRCWPASMPDVLAIGGVYTDQQNQLEASNYASGFPSGHADYGGRRVPDVCGLCGQKPKGIYITLPCPPGSELDKQYGGGAFPNGDETLVADGWFNASGTSSATAQIAGVVALMVERAQTLGRPPLTTAHVKQILQQTAIPVQRGMNAQGFAANGHPNAAVGFGLVNAAAALAII